jgi:hypothetical protein
MEDESDGKRKEFTENKTRSRPAKLQARHIFPYPAVHVSAVPSAVKKQDEEEKITKNLKCEERAAQSIRQTRFIKRRRAAQSGDQNSGWTGAG